MLRRSPPAQARRGCDADAGDGAAPVEGDRDRAGEFFLPRLRGDLSAAAPYHVVPRGRAGPSPLAMIMFEKFGQHQPLNRQCERYALEGAPIALSTLADAVGAVAAAIDPLRRLIEADVSPPSACMAMTRSAPEPRRRQDGARRAAGSMSAMTGPPGSPTLRPRSSIIRGTAGPRFRKGI